MGRKQEDTPDSGYGEPAQFDPSFNGPIKKRGCTDIICCVLFMLVILGYIGIGILAWLYGDPRHVLYPRNSTGWFCGVGPNKDKPNLFYFDILKCATSVNVMAMSLNGFQCPTTQICVEKCPSSFWAVFPQYYIPSKPAKDVFNQSLCVPFLDLATTNLTVKEIVDKELCPFFRIPTTSALGRCFPDVQRLFEIPGEFSQVPGLPASVNETVSLIKNGTGDVINGFSARDVGIRIFEDFASAWPWILV